MNALTAYALDRLAELEDEAALRFNVQALGDSAAAWRAAAARIRAALPTLYRPQMEWFTYHAMADSARSWDHYHLQPVDALVFDGVADTAISGAMVRRLLASEWWDAKNQGFFAVPSERQLVRPARVLDGLGLAHPRLQGARGGVPLRHGGPAP